MFESLAGQCLLASPFMDDPNFFRTVILLLQHTEEEAFGLILNRPTDFQLVKVADVIPDCHCIRNEPLFFGGPVDGPLIAIHDNLDIGGHAFLHDLYVTTNDKELKQLLESTEASMKLFDGFSGWGPLQLEGELETGSWMVSDIPKEWILENKEDLWDRMIKGIGNRIVSNSIQSEDLNDPSLN